MLTGNTWGVFADDTDVHIERALHKHVPPGTTTWCALVVSSRVMEEFLYRSSAFVEKYTRLWGVDALHFTDLVSDRGPFRDLDVSLDAKVHCVREAVDLLLGVDAEIVQQSGYADRVNELKDGGELEWLPSGLSGSNTKDVTLAFLLGHLNGLLGARGCGQALVLAEEHGGRVPGKTLRDDRFTRFVDNSVGFASKKVPQIQLADLVAYGYSRTVRNYALRDIGDGQGSLWKEFVRLDRIRWSSDMTRSDAQLNPKAGRYQFDITPLVRRKGGVEILPHDPRFDA